MCVVFVPVFVCVGEMCVCGRVIRACIFVLKE